MNVELYKHILKERKMTYNDLAKSTGLSLGCIKRIMAGIAQFPRIDTIEAIERALDISNEITQEEYNAGWRSTKKIDITPLEDDAIYALREIRKKYGEETLKATVTMLENMAEIKR